jgi:hypothetical protein
MRFMRLVRGLKPAYRHATAWVLFGVSGIGALISAAKIPPGGETWADTHAWFSLAALGMVIALVGLRPDKNRLKTEHIAPPAREWLAALRAELHLLPADLPQTETLAQLERIHTRYFLPFNQPSWRVAFAAQLDPARAASILDQLARGERILNRLWSAISDDHRVESQAVHAQALALFKAVEAELR